MTGPAPRDVDADPQPGLDRASLMVVSDLEEMFVPLRDGFLVDPVASRYVCRWASEQESTDKGQISD